MPEYFSAHARLKMRGNAANRTPLPAFDTADTAPQHTRAPVA
jgi:hypothetical protein